ncbi:MFS transporter [Actinoplanes sp. CA-030573]|uniref:MFS transporter n=1 Tax=Actinoplanes sp. CA-030573 TaxID=3239898 RepID=UPI003D89CA54
MIAARARNTRPATLAVCLAAAFTTLLDQSSLNTAVPALRTSLGAGPGTIGWIVAGYSLSFGLALVPGGRLGDAHGRKWPPGAPPSTCPGSPCSRRRSAA